MSHLTCRRSNDERRDSRYLLRRASRYNRPARWGPVVADPWEWGFNFNRLKPHGFGYDNRENSRGVL
jgi:hypothetical protein